MFRDSALGPPRRGYSASSRVGGQSGGLVTKARGPVAPKNRVAETFVVGERLRGGEMKPIRQRSIICALLLVCGLAAAAQATPSAGLRWQRPVRITKTVLTDVSCPGVGVCVAVDLKGEIIATTKAGAGRASDWHIVRKPSGIPLRGISCPSRELCVAVGDTGHLLVSNRPTRAHSWRTLRTRGAALDAIACPDTRLCVAGDAQGNVLVSTAPTRATSWVSTHIDDGVNYECFHYGTTGPSCQASLQAVSCAPGTEVCVATDDSGHVFTSSDPDTSRWSAFGITGSLPFSESFVSISCPVSSVCFLANADGEVAQVNPLTSAQPTQSHVIDQSAELSAIACPSTQLCLSSDAGGRILQSRDPGAQNPKWTHETVDDGRNITALSCPLTQFCVALDNHGDAVVGEREPAHTHKESH
jgi:hypothetical protein